MTKAVRVAVSFALGCLIGMIVHYTLYRMGMPIAPFIYMAF
jgi:hypothetical protein